MRIHREGLRKAVLVGCSIFLVAATASVTVGQQSTPSTPGVPQSPDTPLRSKSILNESEIPDGNNARMQEQRERAAKDERHKKMTSDADKLLQLATELKADVDKATKNETSVSAFQKANEIERLAHDVKERLRN
jgi:hypothetical protein